jgi:hypothetical protein
MVGVLREGKEGLLVERRLSRPAVRPGVQGVIVAGQHVLVMPVRDQLGDAAAAPGRGHHGNRGAGGRPPPNLGALRHGKRGLPALRAVLVAGAQQVPTSARRRAGRRAPGGALARGAPVLLRQRRLQGGHVRRAVRGPDLAAIEADATAGPDADRDRAGHGRAAGTRLAAELDLPARRTGMLRLVMSLPDPEPAR